MELATALIWTLRIVLPIILFCIYFKLQSPKDEQYSGSTKNTYARGKLLAHRKAVLMEPVPEVLETMAMKDQAQAPALFANSGRASRSGGGSRREGREDRPPRDRGDREPRKERSEGERPRRNRERPREEEEEVVVEEAPVVADALDTPLLSTAEEKMHTESLLNYVAFNRSTQQRTFLPDEDVAPPPPPKPKRPPPSSAPIPGMDENAKPVSAETSEKANLEAQMVLKGAINFKRADVAANLYDKLLDSQVEISERTFKLMIDACVLARDLKAASDFLMKMETYGYNPDSDILDRVMDLYSQQKSVREQEKQAPMQAGEMGELFSFPGAQQPAGAERDMAMDAMVPPHIQELLEGPRAKLKSDAPIFVPSFGIPPPPPHPAPQQQAEGAAADTAGGETSVVETPPVQRTKLTTTAKPFEPSFGMPMPYDPYKYSAEYGWADEHGQAWQGEGQTEKAATGGKGKGGASQKNGRAGKGDKVYKGAEGNHGREAEWWPKGDSGGEGEWWPEGEYYNDEGEWGHAEESQPVKDGGAKASKGVAKAKPKYKAKVQPPKESAAAAEKETKKQQPQLKVWKPKVEDS